jgi:flavoprotein
MQFIFASIRYLIGLLIAFGWISLLSFLAWLIFNGVNGYSENFSLPKNRCEISGLVDNCPAQPTVLITRSDGLLLDNARGAHKSQEVCLSRASEYHAWCSSKKSITAKFYNNNVLVDSLSFPEDLPKNRCEISGLVDNCPAQPTVLITRSDGLLLDNARGAHKSQEVCLSRASEYHAWCSSKKSITAKFYNNNVLVDSLSFPEDLPKNRCEISGLVDNCPAQPTVLITRSDGLLLDNARGAHKSQEVCLSRASEYHAWCSSKNP